MGKYCTTQGTSSALKKAHDHLEGTGEVNMLASAKVN